MRLDHELDLQELWNVEDGGEDAHGYHVPGHPAPRVGALALVVVLHRAPDGAVPLQGQSQGGVDGAAEDEVVQLVEEAAEGVLVRLGEGRVLADALQD